MNRHFVSSWKRSGFLDADMDDHGRWNCSPRASFNKDEVMRTHMHYTDRDADGDPITVFGEAKKGLFYNYSDRLSGEEWKKGWAIAVEAGLTPGTARFFEAVLNHFHGSTDVNLQHVLLGVNQRTGYDYLVFGYTYTSKREQAS